MADKECSSPVTSVLQRSGRADVAKIQIGPSASGSASASTPQPTSDNVLQSPPSLLFKELSDELKAGIKESLPVSSAISLPDYSSPLGSATSSNPSANQVATTARPSPPPLPRRSCIELPFEDGPRPNSTTVPGSTSHGTLPAPGTQSDV
ncbi:hypothetical protein BKA70DRAFT_1313268 [Coprinopsis sp. MPI-PUGE-AT-0042]|nr:hypothetical protein BKA70DRAFT_1313268 [Coprinopsis sp. MPI-PUGE-AT-0042]